MAEIKKRIVLASVLKPVNDTRMFEKLGMSLANTGKYDVHIIGFPAAFSASTPVAFHTFPTFKRISLSRWFASFRILKMMLRIKPSVIIITTHELLFAGVVAKMLSGTKLIYDVQENYYLNIRYTAAFPSLAKIPVAVWVRLKECVMSIFVDHFFLAEKIYATQLNFLKKHSTTVLENKAKEIKSSSLVRSPLRLIFSGTLSKSTGVFKAIELAKMLHALDASVTLTIIGFATIEEERHEVQRVIGGCSFIQLIGGNQLVSHDDINDAISTSGVGIVAYDLNPATKGRIPTKLYEYLAAGLAIIFMEPDQEWTMLAASCSTKFYEFEPRFSDLNALLSWMHAAHVRGTLNPSLHWKNEEIKLQTAISGL